MYVAGEALFVDSSGTKLHYVERATGDFVDVELFVAVLGTSNSTCAEATRTQRIQDFLGRHVRTLEFLGGVPRKLVPDQLKSAVQGACRYELEVQCTYEELAQHYGTAVVPARPALPRDKAKVEVAVQMVQRWIVARLRIRHFLRSARSMRRSLACVLAQQTAERAIALSTAAPLACSKSFGSHASMAATHGSWPSSRASMSW